MKYLFLNLSLFLFIVPVLRAQSFTLSGEVTCRHNDPLPGAVVQIEALN